MRKFDESTTSIYKNIRIAKFSCILFCCTIVIIWYVLIYKVNLKQNLDVQMKTLLRQSLVISNDTKNGLEANNHRKVENQSKSSTISNLSDGRCSTQRNFFRYQRGDYWVLQNYVKSLKSFASYDSITYTTHADLSFLENLLPLVERWHGPVSVALHAPGTDFNATLQAIHYLRDCTTDLVKELVNFHIYFHADHFPNEIPDPNIYFSEKFNCNHTPPYLNLEPNDMYKSQLKLLYPINVGRNAARQAAETYFVLASDIELYPSQNLIPQFLEMISTRPELLRHRTVFTLNIFEVDEKCQVPETKAELQKMLYSGTAISFHLKMCQKCHKVPKYKEWVRENDTKHLNVFTVGKRNGDFLHWEPIFIGTNFDPLYDERLSWEGKSDKMTQGYILCVQDYDFMILNNAYLVHKPGIKQYRRSEERLKHVLRTKQLIKTVITKELQTIYGVREGCVV